MSDSIQAWLTKHIATVISSIILVAMIWTMSTISGLQIDLVELRGKLIQLDQKIELQMADRFTGVEGRALEKRIEKIEVKLDNM